jgi:alanine dehydrogenase
MADNSRPTPHHDPTFLADVILHDCVTNMPGALSDLWTGKGLTIVDGELTCKGMAAAFGLVICPQLGYKRVFMFTT